MIAHKKKYDIITCWNFFPLLQQFDSSLFFCCLFTTLSAKQARQQIDKTHTHWAFMFVVDIKVENMKDRNEAIKMNREEEKLYSEFSTLASMRNEYECQTEKQTGVEKKYINVPSFKVNSNYLKNCLIYCIKTFIDFKLIFLKLYYKNITFATRHQHIFFPSHHNIVKMSKNPQLHKNSTTTRL